MINKHNDWQVFASQSRSHAMRTQPIPVTPQMIITAATRQAARVS